MHVGGFHAVPGRCRGLQGRAGASKGLQGPPGASKGLRRGPGTSTVLLVKMHGRAGLGHPPWQGGGGGQAEACLQKGVAAVLKGSERPEAGCLGELSPVNLHSNPNPKGPSTQHSYTCTRPVLQLLVPNSQVHNYEVHGPLG